jgi:hypothetical protein
VRLVRVAGKGGYPGPHQVPRVQIAAIGALSFLFS